MPILSLFIEIHCKPNLHRYQQLKKIDLSQSVLTKQMFGMCRVIVAFLFMSFFILYAHSLPGGKKKIIMQDMAACDTKMMFNCPDSTVYIPMFRKCDGIYDCEEGDDENHCTRRKIRS